MAITIQPLNSTATLDDIATIIRQSERLTWEFISLSRRKVNGSMSNIAVFRFRDSGSPLGLVTLEPIDEALSLEQQKTVLNTLEANGKRLICYCSVFVEGREQNVVVFRG